MPEKAAGRLAGAADGLEKETTLSAERAVKSIIQASMDEGASPNEDSPQVVVPPVLHMLQDCLKAMSHPSLLGNGSQEFQAFISHARPEFESQLLYLDVLIGDCQEAMAVS